MLAIYGSHSLVAGSRLMYAAQQQNSTPKQKAAIFAKSAR
jgi:hypothetical protein